MVFIALCLVAKADATSVFEFSISAVGIFKYACYLCNSYLTNAVYRQWLFRVSAPSCFLVRIQLD